MAAVRQSPNALSLAGRVDAASGRAVLREHNARIIIINNNSRYGAGKAHEYLRKRIKNNVKGRKIKILIVTLVTTIASWESAGHGRS